MCSPEVVSDKPGCIVCAGVPYVLLCDVCVLISHPQGYATINLPSNSLSWSEIFRKLEEHKEYLRIEDYSVSQTTLEQVTVYTHVQALLVCVCV